MRKPKLLKIFFLSYTLISFLHSQNIIDSYLDSDITTTLMGIYADGLRTPRDLDFHKDAARQNELWVINENNTGGRNPSAYIPMSVVVMSLSK